MISDQGDVAAFQEVFEVQYGEVGGEQLTVVRRVF